LIKGGMLRRFPPTGKQKGSCCRREKKTARKKEDRRRKKKKKAAFSLGEGELTKKGWSFPSGGGGSAWTCKSEKKKRTRLFAIQKDSGIRENSQGPEHKKRRHVDSGASSRAALQGVRAPRNEKKGKVLV